MILFIALPEAGDKTDPADAIKLYVDYDNKPHLEVYDQLGKSIIYELKLAK